MVRVSVDLARVRDELSTPLVCDVLDAAGERPQVLGPDIVPLLPDSVLAGWAFGVRLERAEARPEVPYSGLLAALEAIGPDEVFVVPTGRADDVAVWGELLSTSCQARGVAGALTDGLVRDTRQVRALGFPVFARGSVPYDINGRYEIVEHRVPALLDGVTVHPGDLVVGDSDGVVVVPRDRAAEVVDAALAKRRGELDFRAAVADGSSPTEAYRRFGVL